MNRWAYLSFAIFIFTVFASPVAFEGGDQRAGVAAMPSPEPTPTVSSVNDALSHNQKMYEAFEAKVHSLREQMDRKQGELYALQATLFDLDQQLTAQQDRAGQMPEQEDLQQQEYRVRQAAALAQLQARIYDQQRVVAELGRIVQRDAAANFDSDTFDQNRAQWEREQRRLEELRTQYEAFQMEVGLDDQRQLERSLSRVMTEKFDSRQLEEKKRETSNRVERLREELSSLQYEQLRAQDELRNLESERRILEQSQPGS